MGILAETQFDRYNELYEQVGGPETRRRLGLPPLEVKLYDKPGFADRYTAVMVGDPGPGWAYDPRLTWVAVGFGPEVGPRGVFTVDQVPREGADLGREITLEELPPEARAKLLDWVRETYPGDPPKLPWRKEG